MIRLAFAVPSCAARCFAFATLGFAVPLHRVAPPCLCYAPQSSAFAPRYPALRRPCLAVPSDAARCPAFAVPRRAARRRAPPLPRVTPPCAALAVPSAAVLRYSAVISYVKTP